jgi:hypothetical protein
LKLAGVEVVLAETKEAARASFDAHRAEISAIFLDGCMGGDGDTLDTAELVTYFRKAGFTGHIEGASSIAGAYLMRAGCDHASDKKDKAAEWIYSDLVWVQSLPNRRCEASA